MGIGFWESTARETAQLDLVNVSNLTSWLLNRSSDGHLAHNYLRHLGHHLSVKTLRFL